MSIIKRFVLLKGDRLNAIRRQLAMLIDQGVTLLSWKLTRLPKTPDFDGVPRIALITVNFSTTYYLKLMLLTLCEQKQLGMIQRIIIVDNDSRDGGKNFLRKLSNKVERIELVERTSFLSHAGGLRAGITKLQKIEPHLKSTQQSNLLLICDTDIIFLNPDTLRILSDIIIKSNAALVGELRYGLHVYPDVQASFFILRRDCYFQKNIVPFVNHGSPAYWMQRSLWKAELRLENFSSNFDGYILHRGRSSVQATHTYRPNDAYATTRNYFPHYMGVLNGKNIWMAIEKKYKDLLEIESEDDLVNYLYLKMTTLV
jgi:hypothetical protein